MITCPFYPPAPSPGPPTILNADPSEFCLQAKANGARCLVLWLDGRRTIFNRHGSLLTAPKGRDVVLAITETLPNGVALDAEYVHAERRLYVFDLPEPRMPVATTPSGNRPSFMAVCSLSQFRVAGSC